MPAKKKKTPRTLSTYELIDWVCPHYVEMKPGSTDQTGVILEIIGLLDGRYLWNVIYTRERFPDGRRANWQLGVPAMINLSPRPEPMQTFEDALNSARALMSVTPLPVWRK